MNDQPDLLAAGEALAEFAEGVAEDSIEASGDDSDGTLARELVAEWRRARQLAAGRVEHSFGYAYGRQAGHQEGTSERDELIEVAVALLHGFGAALVLAGDGGGYEPDPDDEPVDELQDRIARASGAAARLRVLVIEAEGQQRLAV